MGAITSVPPSGKCLGATSRQFLAATVWLAAVTMSAVTDMRKTCLALVLLLAAPLGYSQFPDSPEKRVEDQIGRFKYIGAYHRAIRTLARERCNDRASTDLVGRLAVGVDYLTVWSDREVEKMRSTFDALLAEAKSVRSSKATPIPKHNE